MRASSRRSCGFQIWKVSPVPRNRARSPIWPLRRIIGGQEDAAGAVVGDLLGGGEGHEVALLIFELRVGAGLFLLEQPLELGMLQRRVGGVVGAEAGEGLVLGEDDRAGIAAAFDDAAQECGNGYAALRVDRVQCAALKQML